MLDAQLIESLILNTINFQTLIATKASRMSLATKGRGSIMEFGLRRAQGIDGALSASRACYIGGCAASGGEGTIMGALIGALVMGILNNGMSIMGIGADFQKVVKGAILLLAVTYDVYSKQSKSSG